MHNDNRLDLLNYEIKVVAKAIVETEDREEKQSLIKRINRLKKERYDLEGR